MRNHVLDRENYRRMLHEIYLAKLLKSIQPIFLPPEARPEPEPFPRCVDPQPGVRVTGDGRRVLLDDGTARAAGPESVQPAIYGIAKKRDVHMEVIENLIEHIEGGVEALRAELAVFRENRQDVV